MSRNIRDGRGTERRPIRAKRRLWRALIFVSFCVVLLLFLIGSSESFQHCIHTRKNHQAYNALHEKRSLFIKPIIRLELTAACGRVTLGENDNAVTALATIVLAVFTFALWQSTERLWYASNDALEITGRAFVFLDDFETEITVATDRKLVNTDRLPDPYKEAPHLYITRFAVLPKWKNAGATPTRGMTIQVDWTGPVFGAPERYAYRNTPRPFFLGPNSAELSDCIEIPAVRTLVDQGLSPVSYPDRDHMVLIWGRADYEDVFGGRHFTQWCRQVRLDAHKGDRLRATFIQWGDYNRTDEDSA